MEEEIEEENDSTALQQDYSKVPKQLLPHVFKKGQSGNPSGKPKGAISLKKFAQKYIQELSDEEKLEFLEGIDKHKIWEMAEDKAKQGTDITSGGEKLQAVLVEFIDAKNNTNTK